MASRENLLRQLNQLSDEAIDEVGRFVSHLKKCQVKSRSSKKNDKTLAGKQSAAIKKWAGRNLGPGYAGRDHDRILYGDKG